MADLQDMSIAAIEVLVNVGLLSAAFEVPDGNYPEHVLENFYDKVQLCTETLHTWTLEFQAFGEAFDSE